MPRTRLLVGATIAMLLGGGALVASLDGEGHSVGEAAHKPQSPEGGPAGATLQSDSLSVAGGSSEFRSGAGAAVSGNNAAAAGAATADASTPAAPGGPANLGPTGAAPRVVKTASIQISVAERAVASVGDKVPGVAAAAGGYVTASQRTGSGESLRAQYTLRVPADRFESARSELSKLGTVRGETLGGRDVTGQLVDYEARLRSLRAEEEAFRAILTKANTVGETLQVTQALAEVRGRIEQLDGERARLTDAAALSTIDVVVTAPGGVVTEPESESLLSRSIERSLGVALSIVAGSVIVLGAAVPLSILALLAFGAYRVASRRRQVATTAVAS